jgi:hypothetical protein
VLGGLCMSRLVPEYLLLYSHLIQSIQLIFFFLLCSDMLSQKVDSCDVIVMLVCFVSVIMDRPLGIAYQCGSARRGNEGHIYWRSNREKSINRRDRATFITHVSQESQGDGMAQSMR